MNSDDTPRTDDTRDNGDVPTTPLPDAGPAPEPSATGTTTPSAAAPGSRRSVTRPVLIGAAAGVGVLLIGGLGAALVGAFDGERTVRTVPAADATAFTTPSASATATAVPQPSDDAVASTPAPATTSGAGAGAGSSDPDALVAAIDRAVSAAGGTGASSVEVESYGWSVDVILADGSDVDVRVASDGTATVRADHRDNDADPALDTARIGDIAAAAIAAAGGSGTVSSVETDRDDSHFYSVSIDVGASEDVDVDLAEDLTVVDVDRD